MVFLAVPGQAQGLPDAPKPKTIDRTFLISVGVLAAASTADQITTERFLNRGCHELNPIFGPHPSPSKVAGVSLLYFGGEVGLSYVLKKFGRGHWWSKVWLVEPSWGTAVHIQASVHNEGLTCP